MCVAIVDVAVGTGFVLGYVLRTAATTQRVGSSYFVVNNFSSGKLIYISSLKQYFVQNCSSHRQRKHAKQFEYAE